MTLSLGHGHWIGKHGRSYRVAAEHALGAPLPTRAVVHHHSATSIVICEDQAYHMLLHARQRVVRAGGNPNTDAWCHQCRQIRPREQFYVRKTGRQAGTVTAPCRRCARLIYQARVRRGGRFADDPRRKHLNRVMGREW